MKYARLILILLAVFLMSCSGDEKEQAEGQRKSQFDTSKQTELEPFSIDEFIDTVSAAPDSVAALFLKKSIMEGDYEQAVSYLCRQNRELVSRDSFMQYVAFDRQNPGWDSLTAFKYEMTRGYIPVHAALNDVPRIKKLSCDEACLFEYDVTGPLLVINVFNVALGKLGKKHFDAVIDSNLTLAEKREYYDHAFKRLRHVADSMDFAKRLKTDTLKLIRENSDWKVCKEANNSFDIFRQY